MAVILHITQRADWDRARSAGVYTAESLAGQGFIHCSNADTVVKVANRVFHAQEGLVLLCINPDKVQAEIRYEGPYGGDCYPHIYGPLNLDAVLKVLAFPPNKDGNFDCPPEVA